MTETLETKAPGAFLEECYAVFSLATIDQRKIKGVVEWSGRLWVCLGISHQYMQVSSAILYEAFPVEPSKRDRKYKSGDGYAGMRVTHGKQTYQIGSARVHVLRDAGGLCDRCETREPKHDAACDTRLCDECVGEIGAKREEIRDMATRTKGKKKAVSGQRSAVSEEERPNIDLKHADVWARNLLETRQDTREWLDGEYAADVGEFIDAIEDWRRVAPGDAPVGDSWAARFGTVQHLEAFMESGTSAKLRAKHADALPAKFWRLYFSALVELDAFDGNDPTVSAASADREPGDEVLEGDFSKLPRHAGRDVGESGDSLAEDEASRERDVGVASQRCDGDDETKVTISAEGMEPVETTVGEIKSAPDALREHLDGLREPGMDGEPSFYESMALQEYNGLIRAARSKNCETVSITIDFPFSPEMYALLTRFVPTKEEHKDGIPEWKYVTVRPVDPNLKKVQMGLKEKADG